MFKDGTIEIEPTYINLMVKIKVLIDSELVQTRKG